MSQSAVASRTVVSSAAVWPLRDCHIVVVHKVMSSTGVVVQPLWNSDRRRCCVTVEQHTSPCRSSEVGAWWCQRWTDSRRPITSWSTQWCQHILHRHFHDNFLSLVF